MTPLLNIMTVAVKKVTNNVIRDFNELEYLITNPDSAEKYALNTQKKILEVIYQDLSKIKPNYNFIVGNEIIEGKDSSNFFNIHGIISLDNFTQNISLFSIDITLVRDNHPFAAVSYNPILGSLFYAEKGAGAFFNRKRLRYKHKKNGIIAVNKELLHKKQLHENSVIITNALTLDLCYLATGKYQAVMYENTLIPIKNIMSGLLIAEESGIIFKKDVNENNLLIALSSEI